MDSGGLVGERKRAELMAGCCARLRLLAERRLLAPRIWLIVVWFSLSTTGPGSAMPTTSDDASRPADVAVLVMLKPVTIETAYFSMANSFPSYSAAKGTKRNTPSGTTTSNLTWRAARRSAMGLSNQSYSLRAGIS